MGLKKQLNNEMELVCMQVIPKDKTINHFAPDIEPVHKIASGDTIVVETHDCYFGQIQDEQTLTTDINMDMLNAATGPIYVEAVEQDDVLRIKIENIELDDFGVMITSPELGVLGEKILERTTKILPVKENRIYFTNNLNIPVNPMIGVIGVATDGESIHTAVPGRHGGNLDTKEITSGNSVYFPVFQKGGLFALGDMHGSMGDGELNGTGVEIGGKVTLTATKIAGYLKAPVVETSEYFLFLASEKTLEQAIKTASQYVVDHLQKQLAIEFPIAYRLLSAACDIKISQIVNDLVTVKVAVPKTLLPKLFR